MATSPIQDFSRLHETLPVRVSQRDVLQTRRTTAKFFEEFGSDTFEWSTVIDPEVKFYLSRLIDRATLKVYNEAVHLVQATPEHLANYTQLVKAPRTCGGFKVEKAILEGATPFEQMVALDHVIDRVAYKWPVGRRTYSFAYDEEHVVPVYVASRRACHATVMTTVLGTGRGQYKAPTYKQLAESKENATSSIFIQPLESLEYVRQPHFAGATVLKANAFASGTISHSYRFKVETSDGKPSAYSCVELKQQKSPKHAPIKEKSAGTNMLYLEKTYPKKPLARTLNFEDFSEDGYRDDVDTTVKVKEYWEVLQKTTTENKGNIDELVDLTRNLFVSRVGPFTSPTVNAFYADKLFQVEE